MKKIKRSLLVVLGLILVLSLFANAKEWKTFNLSHGEVNLHYIQHNPIKVKFEGVSEGEAITQFRTVKYITTTQLDSTKKSNVTHKVLTSKYNLDAEVKNGHLVSVTENSNSKVRVKVDGKNIELNHEVAISDGKEPETKQVETIINAGADSGLLKINHIKPEFKSPGPEEQVSKKLGVSLADAENLLEEKGETRVLNAIDKATSDSNRNGQSILEETTNNSGDSGAKAAGGAGYVAGSQNGAININQLNAGSVYQFYLQGPNYEARIEESKLDIRFFYPGNGTQIKGIGANITVVGPVTGRHKQPNNVVLMDTISYNKAKEYYEYSFKEGSWLMDLNRLKPGGYDLYIDLGPSLTTQFGITITEDHQVVKGRY